MPSAKITRNTFYRWLGPPLYLYSENVGYDTIDYCQIQTHEVFLALGNQEVFRSNLQTFDWRSNRDLEGELYNIRVLWKNKIGVMCLTPRELQLVTELEKE